MGLGATPHNNLFLPSSILCPPLLLPFLFPSVFSFRHIFVFNYIFAALADSAVGGVDPSSTMLLVYVLKCDRLCHEGSDIGPASYVVNAADMKAVTPGNQLY